jgi:apolipoprotein N-acyltransferase
LKPCAWAALGGVLFFVGYAGFGIWPLALGAWVPFWHAVASARSPGAAALAGLVFGWVAHAGGFGFLWRLVDVFLGGGVTLGAALWLAHSLWFAAAYAAQALLFRLARARGWPIAVAGAASLVAVEWIWPALFPVHLGDALVARTAWVQIADLGGPLLLSALLALANAAAFETLRWLTAKRGPPLATWALAAGAAAGTFAYGAVRGAAIEREMASAPALRVGVVQANLDVLAKRRDPEGVYQRHLEQSRELLAEGPLDLLVWPETVYAWGIQGPLPVSGRLIRRDLRVPLLFGAASLRSVGGRELEFNSAFLIGADGAIRDGYDKNLLVPIAEQLPFGEALEGLLPHAQSFGAATETPALRLGDFRIATPICYETVEPAFVRRMLRESRANLIVSLANDGWFGDSQEPWLHLALARFRAIEHRRWLVRATNSGVSALIDPLGRVVARSSLLERANLRGSVSRMDATTLYTRVGDWPGWIALAGLASLACPRHARRPRIRRAGGRPSERDA